MGFFSRIALHRFIKTHPPGRHVVQASDELVAAYRGVLPDSLLELWRQKGLGFYGKRQIALIDPRHWQATLERWVVSPRSEVQRIPIALTPFGALLYYRKLTATDEDVAYIDPVARTSSDLAWGLDDFFNRFLCEQDSLDALIPPSMVATANKECGPLQAGEVYEIDPVLFAMQMLRVGKADALALHKRLRDAIEPPQPVAEPPDTIASALPAAERPFFEGMAAAGLTGLYLSSYIDWHRMLALQSDGQYRLLFWRIHHQSFERIEQRAYTGPYQVERTPAGDDVITLDIRLRGESLGSDANDTQLIVVADPERPLLLRVDELPDIAGDIENRQIMGRSEYYFRRVTLAEPWSDEPSDGRDAPPAGKLPAALRAHLRDEPLRMSITHVSPPNPDEEDDGEGTVMCTLDLGQNDGLRMNMPLYSPAETGRGLKGWVWTMDPYACQAGIRYHRGPDGEIEHGPQVGDVLSSRPG